MERSETLWRVLMLGGQNRRVELSLQKNGFRWEAAFANLIEPAQQTHPRLGFVVYGVVLSFWEVLEIPLG